MAHAQKAPSPGESASGVTQHHQDGRAGPAVRPRHARSRRFRLGLALPSAALLVAFSVGVAPAFTQVLLPGGTPLTVDNTSPVDGTEFNVPGTTIDIDDVGQATIGVGVAITAVYAVDTSGSMARQRGRRLRRCRRRRHAHGLCPAGRGCGQRHRGCFPVPRSS